MTALTMGRNTPRLQGDLRRGPVTASQLIHAGALVMRNASVCLVKGTADIGLAGVGRAEERVDNSTGSAGAQSVTVRPGVFRFLNSTASDLIAAADIGALCYAVDDQTVAETHASNTRSPAGVIEEVDAEGVWVRLDAALAGFAEDDIAWLLRSTWASLARGRRLLAAEEPVAPGASVAEALLMARAAEVDLRRL